jgi:hypothetical protein
MATEQDRDDKERQITPPPWGADMSSGILKIVGPITAKKYKQREICRIYGGTRANVDLMTAAPELFACIAEPIPSALPGGTFADDLITLASILGDDPKWEGVADKLREKAKAMHAAILKAKGRQ